MPRPDLDELHDNLNAEMAREHASEHASFNRPTLVRRGGLRLEMVTDDGETRTEITRLVSENEIEDEAAVAALIASWDLPASE